MNILIKGGTIVTDHDRYKADIKIVGDKISLIGKELSEEHEDIVIDATDKYVVPGFIDPHVHLRLPMRDTFSSDDFITGTKAAAAAGVTTIIDFATQMGNQSLSDAIKERRAEADDSVYVDYGLHGGITNWGLVKTEIADIIDQGISSFKMFMAYRERGLYSSDGDIFDALQVTADLGGMILVHAESADLLQQFLEVYDTPEMKESHGIWAHVLSRPNIVETEAVQRAITLAKEANGNLYVVHMSTGEAANLVQRGRINGVNVIGETCPQYLMFDDKIFQSDNGHYYATAPQIKKSEDKQILWNNIERGWLQVIGTDSCTFTREQKEMWGGDFTKIPLGVPGTELMPSLIYHFGVVERKISMEKYVGLTSTNAAKVFGLYPEKGSILPGTDADLCIFDPNLEFKVDYHKMETNADWNPYQGWELIGKSIMTILRGKIIMKDGKIIGNKGYGRYLPRSASGNHIK